MSEDVERKDLFYELCNKYPNYKSGVIRKVMNQFNYDTLKCDEYLRRSSFGESPDVSFNDPSRQNSDESGRSRVFSFASFASGDSGSSSPGQMTKSYRPAIELRNVSSQKSGLHKLDEAYKRLEKHRDFLNLETLYLGKVIERRKSEFDFPNINEVESLDKTVNKKYALPVKSISYANDLRQPSEMANRFAGFHGVYNQRFDSNHNNRGNGVQHSILRHGQEKVRFTMSHSPNQSRDRLDVLRKAEEKRYSVEINEDTDLFKEFSKLQSKGHRREKSDPWVFDSVALWHCHSCGIDNSSSTCSKCNFQHNP